jgi:hypothetical protein
MYIRRSIIAAAGHHICLEDATAEYWDTEHGWDHTAQLLRLAWSHDFFSWEPHSWDLLETNVSLKLKKCHIYWLSVSLLFIPHDTIARGQDRSTKMPYRSIHRLTIDWHLGRDRRTRKQGFFAATASYAPRIARRNAQIILHVSSYLLGHRTIGK